jgi:hypothetical protein
MSSKNNAAKGECAFFLNDLRAIVFRHLAPTSDRSNTFLASLEISPMLLFVHLLKPKEQKPSPQKTAEPNQTPLSNQAHNRAVEHLNQVKANHLLERRLFL